MSLPKPERCDHVEQLREWIASDPNQWVQRADVAYVIGDAAADDERWWPARVFLRWLRNDYWWGIFLGWAVGMILCDYLHSVGLR